MLEVLGKDHLGEELLIGDNKADPRGSPPDRVLMLAVLSGRKGTFSSS